MDFLIAQVRSFGALPLITNGAIMWLNDLAKIGADPSMVTVSNLPEVNQIQIVVANGKITNFILVTETFPV